jgi:hypothetical protein
MALKVGDKVTGAFRVSTGEWLGVDGLVVRATAKALLVQPEKGEAMWCPRSTCRRVR